MTERRTGRDRRRHEREKKRFKVEFGPGDLAHSGYSADFSESGLYLQAGVIYPPGTVLALQIEFPEGPWKTRGVVRWSKDLPPAFKRSLRGGMGLEFLAGSARVSATPGETSASRPPGRSTPASPPPDVGETELGSGPTRRRQISTMGGNTFEIRQTEYRGACYVRIFQLPLSDGSSEAAFRGAYWSVEAADAAVKEFLKGR
jgi:PilZ domain-containing protein